MKHLEKIRPLKNNIKKLKHISVIILTVIFCVLSLGSFFCAYNSNTSENTLNYSDKGAISYSVKLKENEFYEESVQKSNMSYVASLIDHIDINFDYDLKFDNNVACSYNYNINSNLYIANKNAKENEDNVLFVDKEELFRSTEISYNGNNIKISEKLSIPYEKYNLIAKDFASKNGISPDCYLDIDFIVNTKGSNEEIKDISKSTNVKLKIPLYEKLIDIDESEALKEDSGQFSSKNVNSLWLKISIFLSIITTIFLFISVKIILSNIPKSTFYQKQIKEIFKKYDQLIVKSKGKINLDTKTIEVHDFEDLVNVSDRIEQPIKFYEIIKNKESVFVVNNATQEIYVYYVKEKIN